MKHPVGVCCEWKLKLIAVDVIPVLKLPQNILCTPPPPFSIFSAVPPFYNSLIPSALCTGRLILFCFFGKTPENQKEIYAKTTLQYLEI